MGNEYKNQLSKVKKALHKHGLLLLTDPTLDCLTRTITGESIKGSWWGHPMGNLIFNLSNELMDEPDILTIKLINRKITFLEKRHWDFFYSIVSARRSWQLKNLKQAQLSLLTSVDKYKMTRADDLRFKKPVSEIGKLANRLEEKLLIYSENVHTESGKHIRELKTWKEVFRTRKYQPKPVDYPRALAHFELAARQYGPSAHLPWEK